MLDSLLHDKVGFGIYSLLLILFDDCGQLSLGVGALCGVSKVLGGAIGVFTILYLDSCD